MLPPYSPVRSKPATRAWLVEAAFDAARERLQARSGTSYQRLRRPALALREHLKLARNWS